MSYNKQVWNPYDESLSIGENVERYAVVTSEYMNHIEKGIEEAHNKTIEKVEASTTDDKQTASAEYKNGTLKLTIPKGEKGDPGADGAPGPKGDPGEKGEPGQDGQDGVPGRDGIDGQDGKDGAPGKDGRDGQAGPPGSDGAPGKNGVDGQDGITPHIDPDTKHWMLGEEDTGIKAVIELEDINQEDGIDDTPVGHIMAYIGAAPPKHYLSCDGQVYNISEYKILADHIKKDFGIHNFFGGDGITTFAVPDLRGEFLRGAGTAERNTGSGANIGAHQDPTNIVNLGQFVRGDNSAFIYTPGASVNKSVVNADKLSPATQDGFNYVDTSHISDNDNRNAYYTVRPTNTSVLYCIKYEPTYYAKFGGSGDDATGADGKSAYELAVEQGYTGTIDEWLLSLKGEKGEDGQDGAKGEPGDPASIEISDDLDNAITYKADGLYAKDNTDKINEVKDMIDRINKYKKYLNTQLGYCCLNLHPDMSHKQIVVGETVKFEVSESNGIDFDQTTNSVKLKAGTTYKISYNMVTVNPGRTQWYLVVDNDVLDLGHSIAPNFNNSTSPAGMQIIYTPEKDCGASIKVAIVEGAQSYTTATSWGYFIVEEVGREIVIDPVEYVDQEEGLEDTPVGHIISYMGKIPPKHYLTCDGQVYQISKYPFLAEHIKTEFGKYDYFGGDGTTTFAVPDLRGEFLRGTGTSKYDTGAGAMPGLHQDPTHHRHFGINQYDAIWSIKSGTDAANDTGTELAPDKVANLNPKGNNIYQTFEGSDEGNTTYTHYTSRPTNTAVLYCIKYEPTYYLKVERPKENYSLEEKEVGTWIDGKILYEKTIQFTIPQGTLTGSTTWHYDKTMLLDDIFDCSIDTIIVHDAAIIYTLATGETRTHGLICWTGYEGTFYVWISKTDNTCNAHFAFDSNVAINNIIVTFRYTKN